MPFSSGTSRRTSRWGSSAPSAGTDPLEKLNTQINNARLRAEDSGFSADPDKRNWFERATNLPEGQNGFLDALEILSRPGQAILNAIDKVPEGSRNIGEAAWRGFAGYDRVRGSELVEKRLPNSDKATKIILGTGLEIGADPISYIPGGVLVKGAKTAVKPITAGAKMGYGALESAVPKLKGFRENVVTPRVEQTRDALGYMFNRDYKIDETLGGGKSDALRASALHTDNARKFMQEESIKDISDIARRSGGVDTGIAAGRIMESPLRQFDEVEMLEFPDGMGRTTSKRELANERLGNQQRIKELGQTVRETRKDLDVKISQAAQTLEKLDRNLRRTFFSAENKRLRTLQKSKKNADSTPEQIKELATDQAFKQLSPSPAFNLMLKQRDEAKATLDELRNVRSTSGQKEISEIQKLVDENDSLKQASQNPVVVQREIARKKRDLDTSRAVQDAAKSLIKSDQTMRQYALDNGIKIDELEGYMTHVMTQAEKELRKTKRISSVDSGNFGGGNPNKKILSERQYKGSVEDINEQGGREIFQPNAYFATAIGQKRLIDYIQAVKFRREVLSNPDFAQPFKKGMTIPPNATVIDSANYSFIKPSDDILEGVVDAGKIGGEYIVTKAAKNALERFQKLNTDEGTKAFIKAFDTATNMWKKFALFSFGYHARNAIGAMFNNYVGGMNPIDLAKYTPLATKEVTAALRGKESAMYREYRRQGLGSTSQSNIEFLRGTEPEKAIEKSVKEASMDTKGKILTRANPLRAFETSREAGNFIDQTNRYAAYKWAREKLKLNPEQAAAKVREFQFDYSNLAPFEKNVMARIIPFYRWMRNNIPFQIRQFLHDPRKYAAVNKLRLNSQDTFGIDEENTPEWMKQQFAVPISEDKFLALGLPMGDLTKVSNPLKMGVDSLNTLLKTPIELATNRNFFYNNDIEKFEGQEKQFQVPGTDIKFGIPSKVAYALEQGTGQIGRGFSQYLQRPEDVDQDTKFRMPSMGISSVLKPYDVEQSEYFERLDELKKLQDYLNYIEQQTGARPRSVNEIR